VVRLLQTWALVAVLMVVVGIALPVIAAGEQAAATKESSAEVAMDALRSGLLESFNKQDIGGILSRLAPDAVVTWQDGTVCRGREQVKTYYNEKMGGPKPVVSRVTADPRVEGRQAYGDWAVSFGHMNDHFFFTDGTDLKLNSQFTATVSKHGDKWLLTSIHLSTSTFDNPAVGYAGGQGLKYGGIGGVIVGLVVGGLIGALIFRRKGAQERV
jgi:ketosteroid isomerase-like protein